MSKHYGIAGPRSPLLGELGYRITLPALTALGMAGGLHRGGSAHARERARTLCARLDRGEPVHLIGIGPSGHNAGVALISASRAHGVTILYNNEEERFSGIKHHAGFPELAVDALRRQLDRLGLRPGDIHAVLSTWDYARAGAGFARHILEELPGALTLLRGPASANFNLHHIWQATFAPGRLGRRLGVSGRIPLIAMRHHDNHAYFSYAVSPFARRDELTAVMVLDGFGDDGAMSVYMGRAGKLTRLYNNGSMVDSLGLFYAVLSSTLGGWSPLSSEGRYMGAAAWGNGDRLTNPYYRRLREIFHLGPGGSVQMNRALARWHTKGEIAPYRRALEDIVGAPIPRGRMWNPDAILNVDDIRNPEATRERVDKAAATQLVFEDALFHVVEHVIQTTGTHNLVFTGGTALNCVANMRLLDTFNEAYYGRYLGQPDTRLHLWVPPTPGDSGVTMGAACAFAMAHGGVPPGEPLRHAFYCGLPASASEVREALGAHLDVASLPLGLAAENGRERIELIADLMAYIVSRDGVVGIYQGAAETGPRALGHRSILANPCSPGTLELLNALVKFRERVRPLAPMVTRQAAEELFELSPGASDDDYNAYSYMVLTARARPAGRKLVPAIVHQDGTSRLQIVREDIDPLMYAYLKAMGRRVGVEVSVNTSLNVGAPIAQTPAQAIETLRRSKGMDGLFLIADDGDVVLAWHTVTGGAKDGGRRLEAWVAAWRRERGMAAA